MPVSFKGGNFKDSLKQFRDISNNAYEVCEEIKDETVTKLRTLQAQNTFWNNQTYEAFGSIDGQVDKHGDFINIAVGFEAGHPVEYRASGAHEYGRWLADRDVKEKFLAAGLGLLVSKVRDSMLKIIKKGRWHFG